MPDLPEEKSSVASSLIVRLAHMRSHHARYATRDEAKQDTFEYIEMFYNRRRRHSALKYLSPANYHRLCLGQQKLAA